MSLSWYKNASLKHNIGAYIGLQERENYSSGIKKQRPEDQAMKKKLREKKSVVALYPWELNFRPIRDEVNGPI